MLEGRQLMSGGGAQSIRVKEMVDSSGAMELLILGTARADVVTVNDNGSTNPGNITLTFADGRTYTSQNAIQVIQFQGGPGNDRVTYNLNGDLMGKRAVIANLGAGNDTFLANVNGAIRTTDSLEIQAFGGTGNDNLTVNQTGETVAGSVVPYLEGDTGNDTITYMYTGTIDKGAIVGPALLGGPGNDTIRLAYTGQVLGQLFYNDTLDGGAGNDTVTAAVHVLPYSSGQIGQSSSQPSIVQGGDGNDSVTYNLQVDTVATTDANGNDTTIRPTIYASAIGGNGRDAVRRTANVSGDVSNESDAILS